MDGPPTTHLGSGCDKLVCLQGNLTRDTTKFVKNTPVGSRDILQVEQSLGIHHHFQFTIEAHLRPLASYNS